MKLTLFFFAIPCLAASVIFGTPAHAELFTFTATGIGIDSSGVLNAIPDSHLPNVFDVTGLTAGSFNGEHITLLPCTAYDPNDPCVSSGNGFFYDNLLYSQDHVLDFAGIGFAIGDIGYEGGFTSSGTHTYAFINNVNDHTVSVAFTIFPPVPTTVPEPGSFILLGTGLLGLAGTGRRRLIGDR